MIDLFVRGGPLMVPILLASLCALAVFVGRVIALRRPRVVPHTLVEGVRTSLDRGAVADALALAREDPSSLGRILRAGLAHAGATRAEIKERMEEVGRREHADLMRYLSVIAVVASIEPLLGLLGTVTGMIGVFQGVVSQGVGDPAALASGIWAALITTAAGLATGIPAYIGWRYLYARVGDLTLEMEEQAIGVLDRIAADGRAAVRAEAA
ncbi:MAG: MotA/TolQ/ExbB proton channel family protein [Sandaracinaceae bacterium]